MEYIIMLSFLLYGWNKMKKLWFNFESSKDKEDKKTVDIKNYREVTQKEARRNEDNQRQQEVKETLKKSIKYQLDKDNIEEVYKLLSHLETVTQNINQDEEVDKKIMLSVKAKNIAHKLLDKIKRFIDKN